MAFNSLGVKRSLKPREWDGGVAGKFKREGLYVHLWMIHIVEWQKPIQHCKAIIL